MSPIPWFMVDDKLHSHMKAARAGAEAMGLWVLAGSWAADQLTDGFIPDYMALRLDSKAKRHAASLVAAGFWIAAEREGERGWQFHEWTDFQPTKEEVQVKRAAARDRMKRVRANKGAGSRELPANEQRSSRDVRITPAQPNPSHPMPLGVESSRGGSPSVPADSPPPRKCAQHRNSRDAPSCGACKDARLEREDWDKALKDRPTLSAKPTMCGDHPDQPALNCPDCKAETRTDVEALANIRAEIRKRTA